MSPLCPAPATDVNDNSHPRTIQRREKFPPVVYIIGAPGSEKTALAILLARHTGFTHISLENHIQELASSPPPSDHTGSLVRTLVSRGEHIPTPIVHSILRNRILKPYYGKSACILLDGFPRTRAEIPTWLAPRLVLFFDCEQDVARRRCVGRPAKDGRETLAAREFRKRYAEFEREKGGLLRQFLEDDGIDVGDLEDEYIADLVHSLDNTKVVAMETLGKTEENWAMLKKVLERSDVWRKLEAEADEEFDLVDPGDFRGPPTCESAKNASAGP